MRILIYGAGVIGSIFAGKLSAAGNDITVLARGNRLKEIKSNGIVLEKPNTGKVQVEKNLNNANVNTIDTLAPDDIYDYIFVVMQRTQVDEILPILAQNKSKAIVFVVNTAYGYSHWADVVGADRIMLGFPSAGGERKDGKVFYFIGKGIQRIFQTTTFGEYELIETLTRYSREKTQRVKTLIKLFRAANIPSVYCSNMDAWQKTHVAMVTSIANALYGVNCDNYALSKSYTRVREMVLGIKEGRKVLQCLGIPPTPKKLWWFNLPTGILTAGFCLFMRSKMAEITMAKHCIAAKGEMMALQQEFNILIEQSAMKTPAIDKLKQNLQNTK